MSFGDHSYELDASEGATGLVVALDGPTDFIRHGRPGGLEYSAVISLTPDWLRRRLGPVPPSQLVTGNNKQRQSLSATQLLGRRWKPSPSLVSRLEVLSQHQEITAWLALERESVALAMVAEALAQISGSSHSDNTCHWQQRLEGWISSGESSPAIPRGHGRASRHQPETATTALSRRPMVCR